MTHHSTMATSPSTIPRRQTKPMVVQYGCRDEDDEDDDDSEDDRRQSLFGGVLKRPQGQRKASRSASKVSGMMTLNAGMDAITKFGSSFSSNMNNTNNDDDDDDESDEDDHDDHSDDGSVTSKASVASVFSKLGGKLGFKKKNSQQYDDESSEEEESSDEEEEQDTMNASSSSFASLMKVTGKISNALRVSGRRSSLSEHGDESESDEEDLLSPTNTNSNTRTMSSFPFRSSTNKSPKNNSMPGVRRVKTADTNPAKSSLFRRSATDATQSRSQRRQQASSTVRGAPPRSKSTDNAILSPMSAFGGRRRPQNGGINTKLFGNKSRPQPKPSYNNSDDSDDDDDDDSGHISDLSQEEDSSHDESGRHQFNPSAQYASKPKSKQSKSHSMDNSANKNNMNAIQTKTNQIPNNTDWSMNVTEEMLEASLKHGGGPGGSGRNEVMAAFQRSVPKDLLSVLPDKAKRNSGSKNLRSSV